MNRRHFLASSALALGSLASNSAQSDSTALGVSAASCSLQMGNSRKPGDHPKFGDLLGFLEDCHHFLGANGVQIGVAKWDEANLGKRLRAKADSLGMYLEGQIRLPKNASDADRFESQIAQAKEAGVGIFRTIMLSGRRYETFRDLDSWNAFRKASWASLELAEPIVRRQDVHLAVENHKDWRIEEMLAILDRISSEHIGVNLDTGNNISLLEDPEEVVDALAPWAFTTHLKDMGVHEYEKGFLLAEVPLGQGFLDVPKIIKRCRQANPDIRFNLEMITRDPLEVPCLDSTYWTTMEEVPGQDLAKTLNRVRQHDRATLPKISHLPLAAQIAQERENNRLSFKWARAQSL